MRRYYYLISSLPELELEGTQTCPDYTESLQFIRDILHEDDMPLFSYFLFPTDIRNIVNYLADQRDIQRPYPFVLQPGTIEIDDIKSIWLGILNPPIFLRNFFSEYQGKIDQLSLVETEKLLLEAYYRTSFQENDKFIHSWFNFDLQLKNILAISNSRKFDVETKHLLIENIIRNSHQYDFYDISFLDDLKVDHSETNPVTIERLIDNIRWKFIDKLTSFSFFDLHAVFAWFLKLQIKSRWMDPLSENKIDQKMDELIRDAIGDLPIDNFGLTKKRKND